MADDNYKPIICIDFDGVIHSYEAGWQEGELYGSVTTGFWKWAEEAAKLFKLVIYSARSTQPEFAEPMMLWLVEQRRLWRETGGQSGDDKLEFEFAHEKPKAFLMIDDRALTFRGTWKARELDPTVMRAFKPWNRL